MENRKETRDADFTVLMIGQRRTGKSSVLSAMLRSMEKLCDETGFQFIADEDTQSQMKTKLLYLENIFYVHERDEVFSTLEGYKNNVDYGMMTDEALFYRFHLGLVDKKKSKNDYIVEFVDIRGEDMLCDIEEEGHTIKDWIEKCSIIMIAIDSPALMEGKWKKGYGEHHDKVNVPESIYDCITSADKKMRAKLKDNQRLPPKLILFVPLKCEKYYYQNEMGRLNEVLKKGYGNLFSFLEERTEYSVAITPILTLGDVVFDHYKTKKLPSGKEVVELFGDEALESMRYTPKAPLFSLRKIERPKFSPQYCEQPLLYLLAYVMSVTGHIQELEKKKKQRGILPMVIKIAKHTFFYFLFGVFYIAFLGIRAVMNDKPFLKQAGKVISRVKLTGDGYELVQDNLGLKKIIEEYQS